MRTRLHRLGNSQAVVIPKVLLQQLAIDRAVDLELVDDHIELRKAAVQPREGWAEALSLLPDEAFAPAPEDRAWLEMGGPEVAE